MREDLSIEIRLYFVVRRLVWPLKPHYQAWKQSMNERTFSFLAMCLNHDGHSRKVRCPPPGGGRSVDRHPFFR